MYALAMRRAVLAMTVAAVAFVALSHTGGTASPALERFGVSSDAWQRGTVSVPGNQYDTDPIIYLGRSDDPERVYNGGFQAETNVRPGERVAGAFLEGFNAFGQSFSGVIYGTPDRAPFTDGHAAILARPLTHARVAWRQTSVPMRLGYTPDISPIVNEEAAMPGFDGTVTILILGGGGADNQSIDWRSTENLTGPGPVLEVQR